MTEFSLNSPTFRLFAGSSFLEGMAMAVDFAQTMPEFNTNSDPAIADRQALAADWQAIGMDMARAMNQVMAQ